MKAIFSLALAFGVCSLACAADKTEPIGTWRCEYQINNQNLTLELTIKKDGNNLVGTMSWPDQKDEKLKDVKLKDTTLTFSAVRKYKDNGFPLEFTLTIDGDKLKGKSAMVLGDQKQEYDLAGKRVKKDN